MTSEKKYYEPTVEEFHVGFDFECHIGNGLIPKQLYEEGQEWKATAWQVGDFFKTDKPKGLRVKHLDREDVEDLGWTFLHKDHFGHDEFVFKTTTPDSMDTPETTYRLWLSQYCLFLSIEIGSTSYGGETKPMDCQKFIIKNKSELKRLMAQLGII